MKIIKPWKFSDRQTCTINDKEYNVHSAIMLSEDLKVKTLPIEDLYISYGSPCENSLRSFCEHMKGVDEADLKYPILLNQDGCIIDGRHRLAKALILGRKTIKVKRFIKDPDACWKWA